MKLEMWKGGPWPSIGGYVCQFIEEELCHGPGPMVGKSVQLTTEEQRFIYGMYEVHPLALCGRKFCECLENVGKFRYEWAIYCRLKGARKSELAAWLAHVELQGPCRFAGWDEEGDPFACTVADLGGTPDIPFAATSEEQTKDTAWASFYEIAKRCSYANELDVNLNKVISKTNGGNCRVVTSSSVRSDGGRPTFTVEEEIHLWTLPDLLLLDQVLDNNLAKLGSNDPHGVKVSTMFGAGEGSVLEADYDRWQAGDESILFDIRSARDKLDRKNPDDVMLGIKDAIGDAYWLDPFKIYSKFSKRPKAGVRYWWNKRDKAEASALDPEDWTATAIPHVPLDDGELITLGFDGSLYDDSTAIIISRLSDGYQYPALIFYPDGTEEGAMNLRRTVDDTIAALHERYRIVRAYCDPPHWADNLAKWQQAYGERVFVAFWTNKDIQMTWATYRWYEGLMGKLWLHSDDAEFARQVANANRRSTTTYVDASKGERGWVPTKERAASPKKVDAVIASVLAHEARLDAIRSNAESKFAPKRKARVYSF